MKKAEAERRTTMRREIRDQATNRHWAKTVTPSSGLRPLRLDARRFLEENHVSTERIDDVVLALSELASNALTATDRPGAVVVAQLDLTIPSTLKVAVTNSPSAERFAALQVGATNMPNPEVDHGRGLPLVALLATRVAIHHEDDSITVAAEFTV